MDLQREAKKKGDQIIKEEKLNQEAILYLVNW